MISAGTQYRPIRFWGGLGLQACTHCSIRTGQDQGITSPVHKCEKKNILCLQVIGDELPPPNWRAFGNQGNVWTLARLSIPGAVARKGFQVKLYMYQAV